MDVAFLLAETRHYKFSWGVIMRNGSVFWFIVFALILGASRSFAVGDVDDATPPDQVADAIVVYTPHADMHLEKMESFERGLTGRIERQEKGSVAPVTIIHPANSMILPLQAGVPVRLYLKRFPDRDAYYPIAIFPISPGAK